MNPFETYAAKRAQALSEADDRLRPHVQTALEQYGQDGWFDPILNEAEQIFAEVYAAEDGDKAAFDDATTAFTDAMSDFLELTTAPSTPVDNDQVERITTWAATYTGNAAVIAALGPDDKMVWTSMRDNAVRETHRLADGQVRTVGKTFDVGGAALRFPADPLGPLDEVLGCRCLLLREGGTMAREFAATTDTIDEVTPGTDVPDVQDMPDPPDDTPDFAYENPRWHGVIAPEGSPSGDGRSFAVDSISSRDLPLPLRWVRADFGEHGGAVVVGNITALWRDAGLIKAEGDFRTDSAEANEVVGMIATDMLRGVSVDLDDIAFEVDDEVNEIGESPVTLTKGRISAATLVDIPAFPEVFIALGGWEEGGVSEQAAMIASCGCQSLDDTGTHLSLGWGSPSQAIDPDAGLPADGEYPDYEVGEVVRATAPSGEQVVARITAIDDTTGIATLEVEGGGEIEVALADLLPYVSGDNDSGDGYASEAYRDVPAKERKDLADQGKALPDGSFPIANCDDLKNAIQAIGRAKDPEAAKAHIKKRAAALDCGDNLIPEGWAAETEGFAAGTKDGPGWLTNPRDTQRLRTYWTKGAGAAKINWGVPGDFNRCRTYLGEYVNPLFLAGTCANLHKEAIGTWPGRERGGVASSETAAFTLVAAANRVYSHALFERPVLEDPRVGVWVEDDHVFGYIAQWGVCHIGIQGVCTEAPPSTTDYWYYATGVVDTDAGQVKVGQITMDTGHADLTKPLRVAAAHYDNTGSAVADIAVGEDEFGIWFSGAMRPEASESQRHALRAAGRLSGDWRDVRGSLEMVAALAVNVPGFPIPHVALAASGGVQISLVAAGIQPPTEVIGGPDILSLVRSALDQIDYERSRAEKVTMARSILRAARLERARAALHH